MIDLKIIRENPELVSKKAEQKGYPVEIQKILELDTSHRDLLGKVEELRAKRNEVAGRMKAGSKPTEEDILVGKELKKELAEQEAYLSGTEQELMNLLKRVPNMPSDDVPVGSSEDENVIEYERGEKPHFDFEIQNHATIATNKGWLDKERASNVAGARFAYIKGDLVKLQFALIAWITDVLTSEDELREIARQAGLTQLSTRPFVPILPPLMLKTDVYDAMDRLEPRDDRYKIEGEELWLQGSAEHVLGSMHAGEVFEEQSLPLRYLGFATSFRKEAGTYGKDMEGLIRMHQFDKLEMESFTSADAGRDEHLFFVAIQEYILQKLGLPYQKMLKCTFDIGKPNARGVDMNTWMPSQGKYRETHTADYMTDYQARRLKTKVRRDGQNELIHTNDATALALGRGMAVIIENYQTAEGDVRIPEVLQKYIGGRNQI